MLAAEPFVVRASRNYAAIVHEYSVEPGCIRGNCVKGNVGVEGNEVFWYIHNTCIEVV